MIHDLICYDTNFSNSQMIRRSKHIQTLNTTAIWEWFSLPMIIYDEVIKRSLHMAWTLVISPKREEHDERILGWGFYQCRSGWLQKTHWDMTIIENNWRDIYIVDCWYIHLSNQWATIRSSAAMCCQVSDIFCRDLQRFQELFSDGLGRFASPGFIGLSPTLFVQHRSSGPADATKLARHCCRSRKKISQGYKRIHASAAV